MESLSFKRSVLHFVPSHFSPPPDSTPQRFSERSEKSVHIYELLTHYESVLTQFMSLNIRLRPSPVHTDMLSGI